MIYSSKDLPEAGRLYVMDTMKDFHQVIKIRVHKDEPVVTMVLDRIHKHNSQLLLVSHKNSNR